jgi:anti-sigma factor RsiW
MKMCWSVRRALVAYQDGALGRRRAQLIARHLHTCAACHKEHVELQRVTLLLHSLPGPSRAPKYWARSLLQLRARIHQLPQYPTWPLWLAYLRGTLENPPQAFVLVTLVSLALFSTLTSFGLEEEAFVFFSSFLLPIVLE